MNNGTAQTKRMTSGQMKELISATTEAIPTDLPLQVVQGWIGRKDVLGMKIKRILNKPVISYTDWEEFYRDCFKITADLSGVKLPEYKKGFDWPIIVHQGLNFTTLSPVCAELRGHGWDRRISYNERYPSETYAVLVQDMYSNTDNSRFWGSSDFKKTGKKGITLLEMVLFELFYFWMTGKHQPSSRERSTICAGTRTLPDKIGGIETPVTDWRSSLYIHTFDWDKGGLYGTYYVREVLTV